MPSTCSRQPVSSVSAPGAGLLSGLRVVEIAALGPTPWCCMVLAGLGAEVIRVEKPLQASAAGSRWHDVTHRGRAATVALDLKSAQGCARALEIISSADVLVEGMRPGVMEKMGLGPGAYLEINPRLVYGRMTGWGQSGPLAQTAGHDINYLSLTGALHAIGAAGEPLVPPLNLVADLGGGAFLAIGLLAALYEVRHTGRGKVPDVAMIGGVANLMAFPYGLLGTGAWRDERGMNTFDGGAPWYGVYQTADRQCMAVDAVEEPFYANLLLGLGLDASSLPRRTECPAWPLIRQAIATAFLSRTRAQWEQVFEALDACVTPVLSMREAPQHPHMMVRGVFAVVNGVTQPVPAPPRGRLRAWGCGWKESAARGCALALAVQRCGSTGTVQLNDHRRCVRQRATHRRPFIRTGSKTRSNRRMSTLVHVRNHHRMHRLVALILDDALASHDTFRSATGELLGFWSDHGMNRVTCLDGQVHAPLVQSSHGNNRAVIDAAQALQAANDCEHQRSVRDRLSVGLCLAEFVIDVRRIVVT